MDMELKPGESPTLLVIKPVNNYLYRGSRPNNQEDIDNLINNYNIKRIINLQGYIVEHSQVQEENKWINGRIIFYHVPLNLITPPSKEDIERILSLIEPYTFIHCHDGVDRTGVICMFYRLRNSNFSFGQAVGEMLDEGFHLNSYFWWLPHLKKRYLDNG